ncbi:hypothetical protein QQS21_012376 [Conoideocrella luteorostrata]|uniref:Uncharacterized protein n=1 Tax=Conoideocrella luteorostrata TaxID=1105319 RepID=A0AAJ0CE10_9HYPO|nr:hypothetical protein QQS21_012376 [Conoideocrella luteorostrata]
MTSQMHTFPALSSQDRSPNSPDNSATATAPEKALPAPGQDDTTTLDVSGDGSTVKLDHLGPLVVNVDGTMSRIGNWVEMAQIERENALRILGRRNKQRLEVLRKAKEQEQRQAGQ